MKFQNARVLTLKSRISNLQMCLCKTYRLPASVVCARHQRVMGDDQTLAGRYAQVYASVMTGKQLTRNKTPYACQYRLQKEYS